MALEEIREARCERARIFQAEQMPGVEQQKRLRIRQPAEQKLLSLM
jgi:hypothetical protein